MSKKITDENWNENEAIDYESSKTDLIIRSNKRAWLVAFVSLIVTVMSIIAIIVMLPLKRVDLYIVKVDKNGFVEIITNINEQTIAKDEALDKAFITKYVKTKEQYFYDTLNMDFETVQMFSESNLAKEYINFISNPKTGRVTIFKDTKKIEVEILSIVLKDSNGVKTATVRVELKERDKNTNNVTTSIKVITLTYDYIPVKLKAKARLENPLGFIINSYRVDEEIK